MIGGDGRGKLHSEERATLHSYAKRRELSWKAGKRNHEIFSRRNRSLRKRNIGR